MTAASKLRAATVCIGAALAVLLLVATVQPASAREDAATLRSEAEAQVRKLQTEVETRCTDTTSITPPPSHSTRTLQLPPLCQSSVVSPFPFFLPLPRHTHTGRRGCVCLWGELCWLHTA